MMDLPAPPFDKVDLHATATRLKELSTEVRSERTEKLTQLEAAVQAVNEAIINAQKRREERLSQLAERIQKYKAEFEDTQLHRAALARDLADGLSAVEERQRTGLQEMTDAGDAVAERIEAVALARLQELSEAVVALDAEKLDVASVSAEARDAHEEVMSSIEAARVKWKASESELSELVAAEEALSKETILKLEGLVADLAVDVDSAITTESQERELTLNTLVDVLEAASAAVSNLRD